MPDVEVGGWLRVRVWLRLFCALVALALGATGAAAQFRASQSDESDETFDQLDEPREDWDREPGDNGGSNGYGNSETWLVTLPTLESLLAEIDLPSLPLPTWPRLGDALIDTLRYGYGSKFVYFGGFDIWRAGGTAYAGFLFSANGANVDGLIFKGLVAEGVYAYRSGRRLIRGVYALASFMPGWRFSTGSLDIKAYAGLDLQSHRLYPDDRRNQLRGAHAGLRSGIDLWWQPQPWAMVASSFSASTIGESYRARLASGVRVGGWFWLGPEVEIARDDTYRQFRVGAHLTGYRFTGLDWSLSSGYLTDSDKRRGPYARLGFAAQLYPEQNRFMPF